MAFVFVEDGEEAVPSHLNQYGDALSGTPGGGQAILLTALSNQSLYALTVRNQNATTGLALDVQKHDGSGSWLQVKKDGNHLGGVILAQQAAPDTPASGETVLYAGTGSDVRIKLPSGAIQVINSGFGTDGFLLMGA